MSKRRGNLEGSVHQLSYGRNSLVNPSILKGGQNGNEA
jgi:hypothetical protein